MPDVQVVEWIHEKYAAIADDLDERARRRWAAAETRSLGWGGVAAVAVATGISDRTIRSGIRELDDPEAAPVERQRRANGGRKSRQDEQPGLVGALESLVDPVTRGDPMSPLRWALQQFVNETGLKLELSHYPPGTSKWNRIEHRVFCHITRNWRGVPLESHEIVVNLIGATRTTTGLEIHAWLDGKQYEKSKKVSDQALAEVRIRRGEFHGEWNYEILPNG